MAKKVRQRKALLSTKPKAPITLTSPDRLRCTIQGYKIKCKQA